MSILKSRVTYGLWQFRKRLSASPVRLFRIIGVLWFIQAVRPKSKRKVVESTTVLKPGTTICVTSIGPPPSRRQRKTLKAS